MTRVLCEYTISGICVRTPRCLTQCAYHGITDDAAKLDTARRLVAQVNEAEQTDPELRWNPWKLVRRHDPRGG
jgi:hypothetical protein